LLKNYPAEIYYTVRWQIRNYYCNHNCK